MNNRFYYITAQRRVDDSEKECYRCIHDCEINSETCSRCSEENNLWESNPNTEYETVYLDCNPSCHPLISNEDAFKFSTPEEAIEMFEELKKYRAERYTNDKLRKSLKDIELIKVEMTTEKNLDW